MKQRAVFQTVLSLILVTLAISAFGQKSSSKSRKRTTMHKTTKSAPPKSLPAGITTPSGLSVMYTHHGTGVQPKTGETVTVNYTGALTSGAKFDSSLDRGEPFAFKLGTGQVIPGWDEGIGMMHVGDQAVLVIPSKLAYGEKGAGHGVIPPNATLIFIVELLDVKPATVSRLQ